MSQEAFAVAPSDVELELLLNSSVPVEDRARDLAERCSGLLTSSLVVLALTVASWDLRLLLLGPHG